MGEHQRRVEEILREALELAVEERRTWLDVACAGDPNLRSAVEGMLASETETLHVDAAPTPTPPLTPGAALLTSGALLSHYRLMHRLGAGGMGEVWLATDEKLGRQVALKFPSLALMSHPSTRSRLLREARAAAALEHPSVCRVFELGQADGRDFIAMEHIPGKSLAEHLALGPVPPAQALEWGAALAAALEEAHQRGIVHRDLKPGNVMVTASGQVKVLDFGLARALPGRGEEIANLATWKDDLTEAGAIVGTPAYMAPELLKGSQANEKSDLWALGCILYQMLSGDRAFRGNTANELVAAILEREPDLSRLPPETPAEVRLLLERSLRKDPVRRLRDAGDVRLTLEDARAAMLVARTAPAPVPKDDVAQPQPVPPLVLSRRRLLLGGSALGLLGAGFGAATLLQNSRKTTATPSYQRLTFRRGMIRNARFAPDQQTILYGALWDGDICRTFMVRGDSPESRALDLPASTPLAISRSGEVALLLGDHLRGTWAEGTLARVPLAGGAPRELVENVTFADWSPDGSELAISRHDGADEVLEFPIGKVIYRSRTSLSFPRVSPRGDSVAFFDHDAHFFGGSVVIVDRAGKTLFRAPGYLQLFGLCWRGDEVWFTAADERQVFRAIHAVQPPGPPRVVARLPGNVTVHDVSTDGRLLIAHTSDRSEMAAHTGTTDRNLSWLDGSQIADLTPDGRTILFTETGQGGGRAGSIYQRHTDGSPAVRLGEGRALALSPDGRWAIAATSTIPSPHLELMPTGAGEPRRIQAAGMKFHRARWLPDGARFVVSAEEQNRGVGLYLFTLSGAPPRALTPAGFRIGGWAVAPDGSAVAVSSRRAALRVFPLDGSAAGTIPGVNQDDAVRAWIDTGLLVTTTGKDDILFLVDVVTGKRQHWLTLAAPDPAGIMGVSSLSVTPDGRSYAYWWHRAVSDLYLVDGLA
jgi:eukaryotic-like serine/threonine-protein kinase